MKCVSIGVPIYNARKTILDAIRSIYAQSFQDWELILVDDGSTDHCLDLLQNIDDPRVSIHCDGINRGLIYRLNQITSLAQGKYIARMDADDLMHPLRLEQQIEFLEKNNHIDLVGCSTYSIDAQNMVKGFRGAGGHAINSKTIFEKNPFVHPTVVGKANWFKNNSYNSKYIRAEDKELWIRTFNHSHFANLEQRLFFYREDRLNLNNYLSSCHTDRVILRDFALKNIGIRNTALLLGKSYAKSSLAKILYSLGLDSFLIKIRNNSISEEEKQIAEAEIAKILATPIPGLLLAV